MNGYYKDGEFHVFEQWTYELYNPEHRCVARVRGFYTMNAVLRLCVWKGKHEVIIPVGWYTKAYPPGK